MSGLLEYILSELTAGRVFVDWRARRQQVESPLVCCDVDPALEDQSNYATHLLDRERYQRQTSTNTYTFRYVNSKVLQTVSAKW